MTRQEHFDQWMRHNYPHTPLCYDAEKDCYIGSAFLAYQAWKEAPLRRPCEKGQITKEQLKEMKATDDPKTIVDRLNGWYSQTSEPYVVPKIQKEAAREIERLREEVAELRYKFDYLDGLNKCNRETICKAWDAVRDAGVNTDGALSLVDAIGWINKNPASAG